MRIFTSHGKLPVSQALIEVLENRQLLSGSIVVPADTTSPVAAIDISANAGKKFKGSVGTWASTTGLPAKGSGLKAVAVITWGDGKTSHAKLVDDGSGTIQIVGAHTWAAPGTFQTNVHVEEIAKAHGHQITDIGQGGASAVVAPKTHAVSLKGTITGPYSASLTNPDARSYDFTGTGSAGAMGAVALSGSITPPGFIRTGASHGELTLTTTSTVPRTTGDGTITLDVTGSNQNGGSPLPQKLSYVIVGGTGTFANAGGKGKISLALDTTANTFVLVIH